ncbi:MAG: KpsF/GutQ family sugar-phosphate isomerase [Verrucomicrobiota bacterium]|nr:KpsF/GutQ family sugar-phosphate isomerase [Verrucomicrobiota bacterium]
MSESGSLIETARRVLAVESRAIMAISERLNEKFDQAVDLLYSCKGRVVVAGMGKSGLIGRKIAGTLASTGTPSIFLHPADALHGDLGMVQRDDVTLVISYGGDSEEVLRLVEAFKRLGIRIASLTGNVNSPLAQASDVVLDVGVAEEACPLNLAPTASTTATLAMGDAIAIALLERRGFGPDDFANLHPGGRLGRKLQRAESVMHKGGDTPIVHANTSMPDVIYEMSRKGLGMTTVVDDGGRLLGVITDGDLRRLMQRCGESALGLSAGECMTRNPVTINPRELASAALQLMEGRKITSVVVVDDEKRVLGVVHLHDLWALQLF